MRALTTERETFRLKKKPLNTGGINFLSRWRHWQRFKARSPSGSALVYLGYLMSEAEIMRRIQVALVKQGCRLFRNNVGLFETKDGRKLRTGLCVGSADLIGWTPTGQFLAVEVKTPIGKATPEQIAFLQAVSLSGGRAFIARSEQEALAELSK